MPNITAREHELLNKLLNGQQPDIFASPAEMRNLERAGLIRRSIAWNWCPTRRATEEDLIVMDSNTEAEDEQQQVGGQKTATAAPMEFAQVHTQYGPTAFIGRAMLRIEQAINERGVELEVVTLDDLLDINKQVANGWFPLISIFDPALNDLNRENSFGIVGREKNGEIVACHAARFLDWTNTNFVAEAESLRLFYADPERFRLRPESCQVTSLAAKAISGRISFTGAAWLRKDFRRKGLFQLLPRLNRLFAYTQWDSDITVTMMSRERVDAGGLSRPGHLNAEWGVKLWDSRLGTMDLCIKWLQSTELLQDAQKLLGVLDQQPNGKLEIDI